MLDLYNEVADANGLTRLPGPYGATVVRAFSEKGLYSLYFNSLYGYKFSQNFILNTTFTHVARKQPCYMVHKEYFYIFFLPGPGGDSVFSFSLTGLKEEEEEVLEVEFHVYHSRLQREQRHLLEQNMYMVSDGLPFSR